MMGYRHMLTNLNVVSNMAYIYITYPKWVEKTMILNFIDNSIIIVLMKIYIF